MSSANARRRLAQAEQAARAVLPEEVDPEQQRREDELFLNSWAREIVAAAHKAKAARDRGEPEIRQTHQMSGLEVMAEGLSYAGAEPPPDIKTALRELLNGGEVPGLIDADTAEMFNAETRKVLALAFRLYAEETSS